VHVLGISAFYHDSAAAMVRDGVIVAAAQEERFTRRRDDASFPGHAIGYCLKETGLFLDDIDHIVFYEKPLLKFERLLETHLAFAPRGFRSFRTAMPLWMHEKVFQRSLLADALITLGAKKSIAGKVSFVEHHVSHAASAFFPSPFDEAAILIADGAGEWATTSTGVGRGNTIELTKELRFPHSLGLLYSAFASYLGFRVNSGEYKVMGLAPYGQPEYVDRILNNLIDLQEDGSFRLDQSYFDYATGLTMTNDRFAHLFGGPARDPGEALQRRHLDLAASIQRVTEEVMLRMTRALAVETGLDSLVLAGGVALNSIANGKVLRDGKFKRVWIQPAPGDAGGAIGAALSAHHALVSTPRKPETMDGMSGAFLGPSYSEPEIERRLTALGARLTTFPREGLINRVADALAGGHTVGWFQGRMEFGPRALGARSILADPRSPAMQAALNGKIKHREAYRPFAPAVLREDLAEWFELNVDSPYMLLVADVAEKRRLPLSDEARSKIGLDKSKYLRSVIPAVTHVDNSARVQTVHKETNPRFHALLEAFKERTGCGVLVNTSFNVRGQPIVCTPEEAFRCFMSTGLDRLAIGNCLLLKERQDRALVMPPVIGED
jgi:carbamoyltransferase